MVNLDKESWTENQDFSQKFRNPMTISGKNHFDFFAIAKVSTLENWAAVSGRAGQFQYFTPLSQQRASTSQLVIFQHSFSLLP